MAGESKNRLSEIWDNSEQNWNFWINQSSGLSMSPWLECVGGFEIKKIGENRFGFKPYFNAGIFLVDFILDKSIPNLCSHGKRILGSFKHFQGWNHPLHSDLPVIEGCHLIGFKLTEEKLIYCSHVRWRVARNELCKWDRKQMKINLISVKFARPWWAV